MSAKQKPNNINYISTFLIIAVSLTLLAFFTGCDRSSPAVPAQGEEVTLPPVEEIEDAPKINIREPEPNQNSICPAGNIEGQSIQDLASAMFFLMECGGGVLSVPDLQPDEFAIHIWSTVDGENLIGDMVVKDSSGSGVLLPVNGFAIYENASFPISLTVNVPGFSLKSIVKTSANIISLAMAPLLPEDDATIFGNGQNYKMDVVEVYTDTLVPQMNEYYPSGFNPAYTKFEVSVSSRHIHGISAFLRMDPHDPDASNSDILIDGESTYFCDYFSWDIDPLQPGDKRFIHMDFGAKTGPDSTLEVVASFPADQWNPMILENGRCTVAPTAIYYDDTRYLLMGPLAKPVTEDPTNLEFTVNYFDPKYEWDRSVMAGHVVSPDKEIDIVHPNWHPGNPAEKLEFSGFPVLDVENGSGPGTSYPVLNWTDPLGVESDLTRIEVSMAEIGTVWQMTMPGNIGTIDTSDLDVPLSWLSDLLVLESVRYRVHTINATGNDMSYYNEEHIVRKRQETSYSSWVTPVIL